MSKKTIISILAFVIIIGGFATYGYLNTEDEIVLPTVDSSNVSTVEVSPLVHDFETVVYGDVSTHTFKIHNNSDEPLSILKLSTSCGCTKASVAEEDKTIAPGDSVDMIVTFDPAVHKDDSDLGELVRVIYINTDDKLNPEIEARITANVIKE